MVCFVVFQVRYCGSCTCSTYWPIMYIFYPLCYAAVLKILTYYAQYYAQEQEFCL